LTVAGCELKVSPLQRGAKDGFEAAIPIGHEWHQFVKYLKTQFNFLLDLQQKMWTIAELNKYLKYFIWQFFANDSGCKFSACP
jgi:hypothetical protein